MNTRMTVRVNAPAAGIPVRLKVEDASDPRVSVETEALTTTSNAWETLTFDFANQAAGTSAFDPAAEYSKVAIFFNFGTDGATAGAQTYLFDDIAFDAGGGGGPSSVDLETGAAMFSDFEGGVATVIANPSQTGINTSNFVGQMQKFAGQSFGGSTLDLGGTVAFADGDSYTMKVRASRAVDVTLKLEPIGDERVQTYSGSGDWEELCFDFTGVSGNVTGITLIFDNGTVGDAAGDPDNWTFLFDDIAQTSNACTVPPPAFTTLTFDDAAVTYTLRDFGGAASTVTNDPAGGTNMVAQVVRSAAAETFAGTVVSTLANESVGAIPLASGSLEMNLRVYAPAAGIPVRLKVENADDDTVFIEAEATTTAMNAWETLSFDFASPVSVPTFDPAVTYDKIAIFFNFGTAGATAGEQTFFFDDVAFGPGGGGGVGAGVTPDAVVYATDPAVTEDLTPPATDNFGSGAVFDFVFGGDADFNPAIQVTSGEGYGVGVHVGFLAFNGYTDGFAAGFDSFVFKVKADAANIGAWEVKFINNGDTSQTYDLTSYSGVTDIGNGWLQVSIPMSDFAATNAVNSGFLLGPLGGQSAAFTYLMTDIGFTNPAPAGITPDNVVYATDPSVTEDLAPPATDNFGSGAAFDFMFAADADFSPAIRVTSGEGYGAGVHVGFLAFNGYADGFASGFENFVFKVKADAANIGAWEVKFINNGDTSQTYDLTSYSGVADIGNGWLQVSVPMSDFSATSAVNSGFLLGPLGGQPAAFTYLMTDIGFTGTASGGGGGGGGPGEQAVNGDIEAGDLSGFEIFPNGGTITADNTENNTPGGSWSIHAVAGSGNNPVVKQERRAIGTVTGGQTVSISFDMKGSAADGGVIFPELISEGAAGATTSNILETITAPTAGWTTYSYTPAAAADVTEGITFQIAVVCGGAPACSADVFIDNVSMVVN